MIAEAIQLGRRVTFKHSVVNNTIESHYIVHGDNYYKYTR